MQELCEKLGIDYNEIMGRFGGNEGIYMRFLNRFLDDKTYLELEKAWKEQDYTNIEKSAHTLKGIAGNLGLTRLFEASNNVVQAIRRQEHEGLLELYKKVQEEYSVVVKSIEEQ